MLYLQWSYIACIHLSTRLYFKGYVPATGPQDPKATFHKIPIIYLKHKSFILCPVKSDILQAIHKKYNPRIIYSIYLCELYFKDKAYLPKQQKSIIILYIYICAQDS